MNRQVLLAGLLAAAFAAGVLAPSAAQADGAHNPIVFDDTGYHPFMLRPGTAEYDQALQRQAPKPPPHEDQQRLDAALARCAQIAPLSQPTREKCEIRAHQAAQAPQ